MTTTLSPPYFNFESDFVEDNVRCIPMIVRFKLDACGIKLTLKQWSRMTEEERSHLAQLPCDTDASVLSYREYLRELIMLRSGEEATEIAIPGNPAWANAEEVPAGVQEKAREFKWRVAKEQWQALTHLQRFALLKLSVPGHENRNFPIAMREFNLVPGVERIDIGLQS